jgi:hypothetical protein
MAATTTPHGSRTGTSASTGTPGPLLAAGVFMLLVGAFHAIEGVVALASDTFFEGGKSYWFQWNLTAWGWVHIAVGALVAVTGIFLMRSASWAATLALFLCSASILASFLWLPHYPVWSLALIVLDIFVIWAVTTTGPPRGHREHEEEEVPAGYHTPPPSMTW